MTSLTAVTAGSLGMLALVAAASGRALRQVQAAAESALAATIATIADVLGGDSVLIGVVAILGLAAAARFAWALVASTRDEPARMLALLERESAAKGRFIPRTLYDRLGDSLEEITVGKSGTEHMTILFADIRDSTALTEQLPSDVAFTLVAEFFRLSADVVRKHHGTIDKYLGDGYMALFPRTVEDALDAGLALQDAVRTFNATGVGPPIQVGIGMHAGVVTFGTVGDDRHIDTTVVSNTVNTAKRVEGLSKRLGAPVVATGEVLQRLRDPARYVVRPLGSHAVRGKREPLEVFGVQRPPVVARLTAVRRLLMSR